MYRESVCFQCLTNRVNMLLITGFHRHAEYTSIHVNERIGTFVKHTCDISSKVGNELADSHQLTGAVNNLDGERTKSATLLQTTVDDAVEYRHVNITTTDQTNGFPALDGQLAEHGCSH